MKKIIFTLSFFLILTVSVFAKETVRIGVLFPLSGANADKGEANLAAVKMAIEEIPKDSKFDYQLYVEDDQGNPKVTATAVQKLINVNKVDALISYYAGPGNVVAPIAQKNKIIHFGITTDENVAKGEYNFIYFYIAEDFGHKWAQAFAEQGYKRISTITLNQLGCLGVLRGFEKYASTYGIEIISNQILNPGEKDYRSFISKAGEGNPDAYLIYSVAPEMDVLWNQFKQMNIKTFYTGILDLAENTSNMENTWFVSMRKPEGNFQKSFEAKMRKRMLYGVTSSYDETKLIIYNFESVPDNKKPSNQWIVDRINSKGHEFRGIAGNFKFDKELGYFRLEPGMNVFKKGLVENYEIKK
jgi:branched-chain amino acid transport system substrate-binding protein